MTSLERYLNMIDGKPADIVPRIPILMRYAAEHIGSNYGDFTADYRVLVRANQQCAADFGIDQMNTMSDPYRETEGYGAKIIYERDSGAHIDAPPLADGDLDATRLAALPRPDPMNSPRMRDRIEAVRAYAAQNGATHSIMGWIEGPAAEAADVRGVENFFIDLLTDPERAGDLMDICNEVALRFAKIQIDLGADTIGIGDAVASQVSRDVYESLILPREQWIVRELKKHKPSLKVRLHICGNITHLLPGLATLGIDVIDVDHMVDMTKTREALGRGVTLAGNIDPVAEVLRGTPESIRRRLLELYELVGNPFMINAGCEIPSGTPLENLRALCEPIAWRA
ncbi:hypothetical protein Ga0100231_016085 [Opitutaceae bacterium TAV4]|nr:hypothetical protein Ga0100231_016085 [Opitutaceae bacterium TAV4]RRJ99880.1 hypothetical protein Ga0100230_017815 [Opitutaceae bacterium TAV3]